MRCCVAALIAWHGCGCAGWLQLLVQKAAGACSAGQVTWPPWEAVWIVRLALQRGVDSTMQVACHRCHRTVTYMLRYTAGSLDCVRMLPVSCTIDLSTDLPYKHPLQPLQW
jgi:hypothetical protein